jgi:hypothetical protein
MHPSLERNSVMQQIIGSGASAFHIYTITILLEEFCRWKFRVRIL